MKKELAAVHHAMSQKDFPELKLGDGEYVEVVLKRTRIMPVLVWAGICALVVMSILLFIWLENNDVIIAGINELALSYLNLSVLVLGGMFIIIGAVYTYVYNHNILYVTNQRLIQQTRTALFASSTNVIDLKSIEDVSFKQSGILQYLFKFGTIRMATVGDETTYTFPYLDTPKDELDLITKLVQDFKK